MQSYVLRQSRSTPKDSNHPQQSVVLLDAENPLDRDGGICIGDIVVRTKVLSKQREHRKELLLVELDILSETSANRVVKSPAPDYGKHRGTEWHRLGGWDALSPTPPASLGTRALRRT